MIRMYKFCSRNHGGGVNTPEGKILNDKLLMAQAKLLRRVLEKRGIRPPTQRINNWWALFIAVVLVISAAVAVGRVWG